MAHDDFPHNLGVEERASLVLYGRLVNKDPSAASYEAVAAARNKSYSTVKNQLDSARRKMGTQTTWGAYLMMLSRERAAWTSSTSRKPGELISRPERTGKAETPHQLELGQAAS